MTNHHSKNAAAAHMKNFYRPFNSVRDSGQKFDGFIVTGAPIEHLPYEEVDYWDELKTVLDWTQTHVHSTFGVCWGGMAMLKYFHNIEKHMLSHKAFGCFRHQVLRSSSQYLRGFSDSCIVPVSRWTEIRQAEVDKVEGLITLLASEDLGPCLVQDDAHRAIYIFNHFEYDSDTLKQEFDRDVEAGGAINVPVDYFPANDPSKSPQNLWRSHAHILYGNWINEIYQTTPFDVNAIGN